MASNKTYNGIDLIEQLLFIETKKGEFRGLKQDFLLTSLNEVEKEFYVCTKCNGLMRNACQIGEEQMLVCELCAEQGDKPLPMVKFRKKISELRTKCPLERRGCCWKGTIAETKTHLDLCLEFAVNCTNKCDVIMKRADLINHCKSECRNREVNCKHCNVRMKFKKLKEHYKTCIDFPLLCPNECLKNLIRKEVELHVNDECPNTLLNCENECGLKLKRSEMQNHYKNECQNRKIHCIQCSVIILYKDIDTHNGICPEFPLLCPNECLKDLIRKEIESHIENDCPNTMIECPYKKMGCEAVMKRCEIEEHEQRSESKHLKNVVIYFSNETEQMKSNFKSQERHFKSQEQTYKLEIKGLKSENVKLKSKMKELIENISYPVVLRDEIAKEYCEIRNANSYFLMRFNRDLKVRVYDFKWNRQNLQLRFKEKYGGNKEVIIRIPCDKRKLEHINWPVNCKLTIHDTQNSHNSLVFESKIQEFQPESEKEISQQGAAVMDSKDFFLANVSKAQLLEERFRNGNNGVSFTLQMKDVNYFPSW